MPYIIYELRDDHVDVLVRPREGDATATVLSAVFLRGNQGAVQRPDGEIVGFGGMSDAIAALWVAALRVRTDA